MFRGLKIFAFGIAGLFTIITLISLLIPSSVRVNRTVVIHTNQLSDVKATVQHLSAWSRWHPYFKLPGVHYQFSDSASIKKQAVSIVYNKKTTSIQIVDTTATGLLFTLQAPGEEPVYNEIQVTPLAAIQSTQVTWQAFYHVKWYPWEKIYGVFLDRMTGPSYEMALDSLKHTIEQ